MNIIGISELSIIPVRKEPSEKSEMVTQVLFGENFKIISEEPDWVKIEMLSDNYQGWVNRKSVTYIADSFYTEMVNTPSGVIRTLFATILRTDTNDTIHIPFGSSLPVFNNNTGEFYINSNKYKLNNLEANKVLSISKYAFNFLNVPYLWGGKNPFGIDCSGFVQVVYNTAGIKLPRDASQQVNIGYTIEFLDEIKAGDLVFFDNSEGNIGHVGILLSKNEIIHASGKVRIDKIDHQGIYNQEIKQYTHKLRIIKRIQL
jgi:gamma-D-glutamyl-L-lysine dipeptidyl-peptidase